MPTKTPQQSIERPAFSGVVGELSPAFPPRAGFVGLLVSLAPPSAPPEPRRGRPQKHASDAEKRAAAAEAAKAYRDRQRAAKAARRDPGQPLTSAIIDLSETRQRPPRPDLPKN